ncbi:uncharacterized protein LOC123557944 isoform X2 [Mercenaria mercenaria]|nr:uncharacterized protein LOC123557944 isoform X2 [Mercenaria mercenaria]
MREILQDRLRLELILRPPVTKERAARSSSDQSLIDKVREAKKRQRQKTSNKKNVESTGTNSDTVPKETGDNPYRRLRYIKALQDGKETDRCIRINVVGNFAQGKTTLVRRLVGESIDGVEATNGIDVDRYRCEQSQDGNLICIKSDESDVSNKIQRLYSTASSSDLTDTDNSNDLVTDDAMPVLEKESQKLPTYFEVINEDEQESVIFDIWDFSGQYVFYATHTMFHSRKAIYLLVMNLSLDMDCSLLGTEFPAETGDRNVEYIIQFWLNSIHSFVGMQNGYDPLIILVGTHKDKLHGDENAKQLLAKKYFEDVRKRFENTDVIKHIHSKDFVVDNMSSTDCGIESLRMEIVKLGKEKAINVKIPAKWIPLEDALQKRRNENIISLEDLKKIDAGNILPLGDEEQIKLLLQYHHAKGTLFFFDEYPVSDYVVINPQYLIDAFKCIITSQRFCRNDHPEARPLWSCLVKEAKLENDFIDFQWKMNKDKNFMANREILLFFLKKQHIISEVMRFDEQCQVTERLGWYIVPSLLKNQITQTKINDILRGKKQTIVRIALLFDNSAVLPTICHRLFAAALGNWSIASFHDQFLLFEDYAVFRLDMYETGIIILNVKERTIELQVLGLGCSPSMGDNFRRFAEKLVNHEFRKLNTSEHVEPYRLHYRCSHTSHGVGCSQLADLSLIEGKQSVPCPDLENHKISVNDAKQEWFLEGNISINEIPQVVPSEKQLSKISNSIGENWEILGLELGLKKVQIDHLNEDNQDAIMKKFGMLLEWRKQKAERATIDVLVKAIKRVPTVRIDWDIIRNFIDEIGLEVLSTCL